MDPFTPPFERGVSMAADEARERAARDEPIAQAIAFRLIWNLNSCENYGHGHLDGPLAEVLITAVFRDHVAALVGQACGRRGRTWTPSPASPLLTSNWQDRN
jgi:hypothetical protein